MKLIVALLPIFLLICHPSYAEEASEEEGAASTEEATKSGVANPDLPRVGSLNMEVIQQRFLSEEYATNELVWLDVSYPIPEGEPVEKKVLALQQKSHKAQQHGAVLILHDLEQHADWPVIISPLRKKLPEAGWYTLSINLPSQIQYRDGVPERVFPPKAFDEIVATESLRIKLASRQSTPIEAKEETEESVEAPQDGEAAENLADTETVQENTTEQDEEESNVDIDLAEPEDQSLKLPYADRVMVHLEAGLAYLTQQGYQNTVIVAYRASANPVMRYMEKTKGQYSDRGFALVLIDPRLESTYQDDIAKALGEKFPAPVLEINSVDSPEAKVEAAQRQVSARVSGAMKYSQLKMPSAQSALNRAIPRRITYWLEKNAPGMVVSNR